MLPPPVPLQRAILLAAGAAACVAGLAAIDIATRTPFLFPSLGATTFLLVAMPSLRASAPRNAFFGHLIGASCGWVSLWTCGLAEKQAALGAGIDTAHFFSTALALGLTTLLLLRFRVDHPPAGATTLIVGLGLLPHLWQVPMVGGSALFLALEARLFQRLAGLPLPWWGAARERQDPAGR